MGLATVSIATALLSVLATNPFPFFSIEAASEQPSPVYIGATPFEMARSGKSAVSAILPEKLKKQAEASVRAIASRLKLETLELEAWPTQDSDGQRTWAFARYRRHPTEPWRWLDRHDFERQFIATTRGDGQFAAPIFATNYRTWHQNEFRDVFSDFLSLTSLYDKPVFSRCVWTDEQGTVSWGGWFSDDEREKRSQQIASAPASRWICRALPPPARFNSRPVTFVFRLEGHHLSLSPSVSPSVRWVAETPRPRLDRTRATISAWPRHFDEDYARDVRILAGQQEIIFPISGYRTRFARKNNADPENQLESVERYLEERYAKLGIPTRRQRFTWRGIPQSNLVAIIRGQAGDGAPVIMADHIDTAFAEDWYARTGQRFSAPGADDNATATATLLRAAEVFKNHPPLQDVWLLHLTGEEFPADCLGARRFVASLLKESKDIRAIILLDMIGYRRNSSDAIFQINAGESVASLRLASAAFGAASITAPSLKPVLRTRFDERSYLYNTDGVIFSDVGFPVVLLNEHINKHENFNRPYYHQTTDLTGTLDWTYATSIARVAIETAAQLAAKAKNPVASAGDE